MTTSNPTSTLGAQQPESTLAAGPAQGPPAVEIVLQLPDASVLQLPDASVLELT